MQKFYTIENLAEMFRVSTRTILREKLAGKIPFLVIRGRVRFREQDVQVYLDSMAAIRSNSRVAQNGAN